MFKPPENRDGVEGTTFEAKDSKKKKSKAKASDFFGYVNTLQVLQEKAVLAI